MIVNTSRRVASRMSNLHLLINNSAATTPRSTTYSSSTIARNLDQWNNASASSEGNPVHSSLFTRSYSMISRPISSRTPSTNKTRRRFSTSKDSTNKTPNPTQTKMFDPTQKYDSPKQQTQAFLHFLGYSEPLSDGIIDALLQNGIPPSSLFGMMKSLAGRYEVDEDGGLEALAASVQLELDKVAGKSKVKIWCLPSTGWSPAPDNSIDGDGDIVDDDDQQQLPIIHSMDRAFAVEATEGTTLTDVAKFGTSDNCDVLGEYLECSCAGIMACSTCHVVIHPDWYNSGKNKVDPPSEAELDMIDLAYEPQLTSRLGCQIKLTKELDGLVVLLPRGSNNLMDFVPFE